MFRVSFGENDVTYWINAENDDHEQGLNQYLNIKYQPQSYTPGFFNHDVSPLLIRKNVPAKTKTSTSRDEYRHLTPPERVARDSFPKPTEDLTFYRQEGKCAWCERASLRGDIL